MCIFFQSVTLEKGKFFCVYPLLLFLDTIEFIVNGFFLNKRLGDLESPRDCSVSSGLWPWARGRESNRITEAGMADRLLSPAAVTEWPRLLEPRLGVGGLGRKRSWSAGAVRPRHQGRAIPGSREERRRAGRGRRTSFIWTLTHVYSVFVKQFSENVKNLFYC